MSHEAGASDVENGLSRRPPHGLIDRRSTASVYCTARRRSNADRFQQQELKRKDMQDRHSFRSEQRERELEAYRIKYGNRNSIHVDYVGVA